MVQIDTSCGHFKCLSKRELIQDRPGPLRLCDSMDTNSSFLGQELMKYIFTTGDTELLLWKKRWDTLAGSQSYSPLFYSIARQLTRDCLLMLSVYTQ